MSTALRTRNVLGLLGAFVVTSLVAGVLAAGLAIPAVGASGLATKSSVNFFNSLPSDLKQPPLSQASRLEAADGSTITTWYDEYRQSVPLNKISQNMQHAIVAIEDARFYEHGGVDPKGLLRAFTVNQINGGVEQGASTITQQYVKNVLKETAYVKGDEAGVEAAAAQTNERKLKEIRYAVTLEKTMTKPQILNAYLNIAWFGGKVNGIQAASRYYFNTTAAKLTVPQAAMLAGMIQSPPDYNPVNHPAAALLRRNTVLHKMLDQHMIDQATFVASVTHKINPHITPAKQGCANAGYKGYFCDYVYNLIINGDGFTSLGKTPAARANALLRGGLTIKTTMDPKIEQAAWNTARKIIPPKDPSHVATATVTVQPGTGNVLSIQQDKTYTPTKGQQNTTVDYSVDYKYGGSAGFQTGSTFKAFTLATWLKAGKSLNASVVASAGSAPFSDFTSCGRRLRSTLPYTYSNSSDGEGNGPMTVWDATAQSVNGAFISMEKQLDLCDIRTTAEQVGVHLAAPRHVECGTVEQQHKDYTTRLPTCVPSLTLGVESISPMTMASAYAAFAAGGMYCTPVAVSSITDRNGNQLKIPGTSCKQTLDRNVANTVTLGLSKVFSHEGTGARLGGLPGRQSSGKTGTTNGSTATWFVGYTPQLATAVWVGDPDLDPKAPTGIKPLRNIVINGIYHSTVFGADLAGPIWEEIMKSASQGMPVERFDTPDGSLLKSSKAAVPNEAGKSPADAKSDLVAAGFTTTIASSPVPSAYPAGTVASTSPAGGSKADVGSQITITLSSGGGVTIPGGVPTPGTGNNGGGFVPPPKH